jgi:serine/threonine protein kinase
MEKSSLAQPDFHHRFTPLRRLGRGAEATVYSAIQIRDSQVVAVKAFSKQITFSMLNNKGKVTTFIILGNGSKRNSDIDLM